MLEKPQITKPLGKVFLLGAGPGDPELITVKGVKALQQADVVIYDDLVNPQLLEHCSDHVKIIPASKLRGRKSCAQDKINNELLILAQRSEKIVRLKCGDPLVFARGGEEIDFLRKHDIEFEIIPGITSSFGAAAAAELSLTHRDSASRLVFHTGHSANKDNIVSFMKQDFKKTTHVIYMGVKNLPEIISSIKAADQTLGNLPIAIIENATHKDERIHYSTVDMVLDLAAEKAIAPPAIIIISNTI